MNVILKPLLKAYWESIKKLNTTQPSILVTSVNISASQSLICGTTRIMYTEDGAFLATSVNMQQQKRILWRHTLHRYLYEFYSFLPLWFFERKNQEMTVNCHPQWKIVVIEIVPRFRVNFLSIVDADDEFWFTDNYFLLWEYFNKKFISTQIKKWILYMNNFNYLNI